MASVCGGLKLFLKHTVAYKNYSLNKPKFEELFETIANKLYIHKKKERLCNLGLLGIGLTWFETVSDYYPASSMKRVETVSVYLLFSQSAKTV